MPRQPGRPQDSRRRLTCSSRGARAASRSTATCSPTSISLSGRRARAARCRCAAPAAAAAAHRGGTMPPTLFESALQTLMGRPFGWLIVADPTDLLEPRPPSCAISSPCCASTTTSTPGSTRIGPSAGWPSSMRSERPACGTCGCWSARRPSRTCGSSRRVLVGSADLSAHPYRLRCPEGAQEFADVLATKLADPADGSPVPFAATAGALAALTGLPRREVPGVRVLRPGYFDVTSEVGRRTSRSSLATSWTARTGQSARSASRWRR